MYGDFNEHAKTGSYYDTDGGYIHYDSSEHLNQPKKKKKGGFGKTLAKCLVLALVFGSVSSAAFMGTNYIGRQMFGDAVTTEGDGNNNAATPTTTVAGSSSDVYDVSDIVTNCMPSVVSITNVGTTEFRTFFGTYEQESQSSGSGIIIGRNDTEILIVTNNHVVSKANEISVYFNSDGEDADEDNVISAKVKGTDPGKDLAVIAVKVSDIPQETLDIIKIATIGDSGMLAVGEPVVAIGNAYGYGLSVTSGIVSALNREVSVESDGMMINNRLIQTDAAINPGNSGGALLNANGEVIGINTIKVAVDVVEGMGYAIPISDAQDVITNLMNQKTKTKVAEGEQGYLGVQPVDVSEDSAQMYGMPTGVYVSEVVSGSGAQAAGITKGCIITKIEGTSITSTDTLREQLQYYAAGETVKVTIQVPKSNGEYKSETVNVTLGKNR